MSQTKPEKPNIDKGTMSDIKSIKDQQIKTGSIVKK